MQALIFLSAFLLCSSGFLIDIREISAYLHDQCLSVLSLKGRWAPVYKALICGERLPQGSIKQVFIEGGLIHLMVVSGAHLLFLEKLWTKLPLPVFKKSGLFFFLIFYALITELHPPVVRALFSFFLFQLSQNHKLFWGHFLITHLSGVLCLFYSPYWIRSISLQLSWLASLAHGTSSSSLKKAFLTYIIVFPIVSQWQFLHPLTVFINWSLAPLIGFVLLPLSFITAFFPFFQPFSDKVWNFVFFILKWANQLMPDWPRLSIFKQFQGFMWFYIGGVFLISCVVNIWAKRMGKRHPYNKI